MFPSQPFPWQRPSLLRPSPGLSIITPCCWCCTHQSLLPALLVQKQGIPLDWHVKGAGRCLPSFLFSMEETVFVALYPVPWGIQGGHGYTILPFCWIWGRDIRFGWNSASDGKEPIAVLAAGREEIFIAFRKLPGSCLGSFEPIPDRPGCGLMWHH